MPFCFLQGICPALRYSYVVQLRVHNSPEWCRYPPFYDQDITNTYKKIISGHFTFPSYFPVTARDLVRKLLQVSLWAIALTTISSLQAS